MILYTHRQTPKSPASHVSIYIGKIETETGLLSIAQLPLYLYKTGIRENHHRII